MRLIGNGWPQASLLPLVIFPTLALALLTAACAASNPPEEVVDAYLSETKRGDALNALKRWELSELGPAPVDLAPEQQRIRLDTRRELAETLTDALSAAGERLQWEGRGLVLYHIRDGVANLTEVVDEANVATVEVGITVERSESEDVEERLAFTLWKRAGGGWSVTGLDKGLAVLEGFLEELWSSR